MPNPSNTAVLIDVDKTLLLGAAGTYNMDLINALKRAGINQIYLFTSMSLLDIVEELVTPNYSSRPKLIEKLKQEGIEVSAVLTPADVGVKGYLGFAYQNLFEAQHKRVRSYKLNKYNYKTDPDFADDRYVYDVNSKKTATIVEEDKRYSATEKSKLFEHFILKRPAQVEQCIIIDDDEIHIQAIEQFFSLNLESRIYLQEDINNQDENISAVVNLKPLTKLTCIRVKKDSDENYFDTELSKALPKPLPKPSFFAPLYQSFEDHPYIWDAVKWLLIGAGSAALIYFTGGIAAIPYLAKLGAWAIPALAPVVAAVEAAITRYVLKPFYNYLLSCFSGSEKDEPKAKVAPESLINKGQDSMPGTTAKLSSTALAPQIDPYTKPAEAPASIPSSTTSATSGATSQNGLYGNNGSQTKDPIVEDSSSSNQNIPK